MHFQAPFLGQCQYVESFDVIEPRCAFFFFCLFFTTVFRSERSQKVNSFSLVLETLRVSASYSICLLFFSHVIRSLASPYPGIFLIFSSPRLLHPPNHKTSSLRHQVGPLPPRNILDLYFWYEQGSPTTVIRIIPESTRHLNKVLPSRRCSSPSTKKGLGRVPSLQQMSPLTRIDPLIAFQQ